METEMATAEARGLDMPRFESGQDSIVGVGPSLESNGPTKFRDEPDTAVENLFENSEPTTQDANNGVVSAEFKSKWDELRHKFENGPPGFEKFRDWFSLSLNIVGIAFNALGVVGIVNKSMNKKLSEFLDKKSEWYSRYIVPFSFAWSGIEAVMGNRLFESILRFIPAISFWALPFYNFNFATGISSGFNALLGLVNDRYGGKQPNDSIAQNTEVVFKTFGDVFKDAITKKKTTQSLKDELQNVIAAMFMLGGSFGGMFFAHRERDTWLARLFGNMRNAGGIITDIALLFHDHPPNKKVGIICGVASILNIIMRWVSKDMARAINHIAIAMDDLGLTYWAHESRRQNKLKKKAEVTMPPSNDSRRMATEMAA